jgi:hypothetical protein
MVEESSGGKQKRHDRERVDRTIFGPFPDVIERYSGELTL